MVNSHLNKRVQKEIIKITQEKIVITDQPSWEATARGWAFTVI